MLLGSFALAPFVEPSDRPPGSAAPIGQKAQPAAAGRALDAAEAIMGDGRAPEPALISRLQKGAAGSRRAGFFLLPSCAQKSGNRFWDFEGDGR
jgi:hypothetical protein